MAHSPAPQHAQPPVPPAPPDAENPAILDAEKTFKIAMMSAVLFVLAAVLIVLRTRMG
jgi:hypothetical protein